jgi:uncharacterized low-complexity protein
MSVFSKKPIAMALGAAFALNGLAAQAASQGAVFQAADLPYGYTQLAEGKCGEGKCGAEKKAGEGKCGAEKKAGEGKCGAEKKAGEGKCGEGKCGGTKTN